MSTAKWQNIAGSKKFFTAFLIKEMSTKFESQPRRYVRFLGKNTASFSKIEKRMSKPPQFLRKRKMG